MALKETSLEVIEKMSRKELKRAMLMCFSCAPEAQPVDRLAVLQEAQFYSRELERRHDSWTSLRDLILEIFVIFLIGWEIHMSYRAERLERDNFDAENIVFQNLEKSLGATVDTMVAMNKNVHAQLDLYYEPSVDLTYDAGKVVAHNYGHTSIAILATKVNYMVCSLDPPQPIQSSLFGPVNSQFVVVIGVEPAINMGMARTISIYFTAENGVQYQTSAVFEAKTKGGSVIVRDLKTTRGDWKKDRADAPKEWSGRCEEGANSWQAH
jgi:hypothetical protein